MERRASGLRPVAMSGFSLGVCDGRDFCRSSIRDSTIGINFDALGEVEHFDHVSGDLFDLLKSGDHADVTFLVDGVRLQAHRVILAARCSYFKVLLFGQMREAHTGAEIPITDATPESFKALLEYVYSGRVCLGDLSEQVTLDLLGLANKYDFCTLQHAIMSFLKATLTVANVCHIFNVALFYQLKELSQACTSFVDMNASQVMKSDGFCSLNKLALVDLLSRDSFFAPEMDVFNGVQQWMEANEISPADAKDLLMVVRLSLIPLDSLLYEVRESKLFDDSDILDAIATTHRQEGLLAVRQRGLQINEENVATPHRDACVSDNQSVLINGDTDNYSGDHGYASHIITKDASQGIIVKLSHPYIINCIRMLLWDRDNRSYSYYIQVSLDNEVWVTVVDRNQHLCRSWQELFFKERVVRYIRIVGTYNSMNKSFHLVSFACLYTCRPFNLSIEGLIVPTENVASISYSATVLEGVSRSRNALLNGNTRDYDWDSGYTCHQLGSGYIVVQLSQPYIVSSMRLLLWDCDDRAYSYYIEVSTDQKKWTCVADKTKEACRSWQVIQFDPVAVTFVKIVGTNNTANEVFHCVHFECPAANLGVLKHSLV